MPRVRSSSVATPLIVLGLATSLVLTGCSSDSDQPDAAPTSVATRETPSSATDPSTQPPAASSAVPTQRPGGHQGRQPGRQQGRQPGRHKVGTLEPRMRLETAAHLLDADSLPPVGDETWVVASTGPEDPSRDPAVGACQKTLLGPIGAVETVRRTFTAPGRLTATQVVARFADPRSAWRAHAVLVAWRDDCTERVAGSDVGPLRPIDVRSGTGESYRTAARKRAAGLAILRTGEYLTLVEVTAGARHYPTSWDPARVAARRIARTF